MGTSIRRLQRTFLKAGASVLVIHMWIMRQRLTQSQSATMMVAAIGCSLIHPAGSRAAGGFTLGTEAADAVTMCCIAGATLRTAVASRSVAEYRTPDSQSEGRSEWPRRRHWNAGRKARYLQCFPRISLIVTSGLPQPMHYVGLSTLNRCASPPVQDRAK